MSFRSLEALLDALIAEGARNPVLRIEAENGEALFEGARGVARADEGAPMRPQSRFHIASVTKTMTAVVVLRALERLGDVDAGLDRPIAAFGAFDPEILERLARREGMAFGPRITLRQLLNHTAGLRDAFEDDAERIGAAPKSLGAALLGGLFPPHKTWPAWDPERPFDAEAGVVNWYLATGLGDAPVAPPGARFHYSDTGYMIAALIVEKLEGKPYHRLLREEVFAPAGLSAQTYLAYKDDPADLGANRAPESDVWANGAALLSSGMNLSFDWGGGGVVSTAADLVRLLRALLGGTPFATEAARTAMTEWVRPPDLPPPRIGVGLGLDLWSWRGRDIVGRSGFWGARMAHDPQAGLYVAGTVNAAGLAPDWHFRALDAAREL